MTWGRPNIGQAYTVLNLLRRANGAVSYELIRYQLWLRLGKTPPKDWRQPVRMLRSMGYGVVNHDGIGYQLVPELAQTFRWYDKKVNRKRLTPVTTYATYGGDCSTTSGTSGSA